MYSDSNNPFALLGDRLVSIQDVQSGLDCGCRCLKCKQPLVAKKGSIKVHHFAHYSKTDCSGSLETALHIKAKDVFLKNKYIMLPPSRGPLVKRITKMIPDEIYKRYDRLGLTSQYRVDWYSPDVRFDRLEYEDVFIETNIGKIRPDIILSAEKPFIVEIYVTHKVDFYKIKAIKELCLPAIEIDLRYLRRLDLLDEKLIENAVVNCTHTKKWLNMQ